MGYIQRTPSQLPAKKKRGRPKKCANQKQKGSGGIRKGACRKRFRRNSFDKKDEQKYDQDQQVWDENFSEDEDEGEDDYGGWDEIEFVSSDEKRIRRRIRRIRRQQ
ncbi:MAG: hypothetical protein EZS28_040743 [Streblomastix strix]|uniref:Uncharacterized protein n=1 Tax=Streblomastix strix TaxID=222440 RepID=A0A5J4U0P5_9EUKA|nr:MAG: hypothetical protein EZS28_040743 [Streblomastix strix]